MNLADILASAGARLDEFLKLANSLEEIVRRSDLAEQPEVKDILSRLDKLKVLVNPRHVA